jgi:hypothetical protein
MKKPIKTYLPRQEDLHAFLRTFRIYLAKFLSEWKVFRIKFIEKIETQTGSGAHQAPLKILSLITEQLGPKTYRSPPHEI